MSLSLKTIGALMKRVKGLEHGAERTKPKANCTYVQESAPSAWVERSSEV
eukprot:SAG11_NODE_13822_length_637_cov_9.016729_1_plen_49_part_01